MEREFIESSWNDFINSIKCNFVERFVLNGKFLDIVSKMKMKLRTMMNFQHVLIAMQEDAYFVSGDKDIIRKVNENGVYDKALTYIELIKLANYLGPSGPSHTRQDA